jgi:hypothetical protein
MALWHRANLHVGSSAAADDGSVYTCSDSTLSTPTRHRGGASGGRGRRRQSQRHRRSRTNMYGSLIAAVVLMMMGLQRYRVMYEEVNTPGSSTMHSLGSIRHAKWHPSSRRERFPSVQERVRLYMSIWYQPSDCNKLSSRARIKRTTEEGESVLEVKSSGKVFRGGRAELNVPLWLSADLVQDCSQSSPLLAQLYNYLPPFRSHAIPHRQDTVSYCRSVWQDSNMLFDEADNSNPVPILAQFGMNSIDASDGVPVFGQYRAAASSLPKIEEDTNACRIPTLATTSTDQREVYPPIVWPLGQDHDYVALGSMMSKARKVDTPWEDKKNKGVWRGIWKDGIARAHPTVKQQNGNDGNWTVLCQLDDSVCDFVVQHAGSDAVDVGYYCLDEPTGLRNQDIPEEADLVFKTKLDLQQMQQHKLIFVLDSQEEDNFLWSLSSSSVVGMPPPTRTSWCMEELLVPWVHYIPLPANTSSMLNYTTAATDLVQWVATHDDEAQRIAERASLYIHDLFFHLDAARDNDLVKKEILRRYRQYWA